MWHFKYWMILWMELSPCLGLGKIGLPKWFQIWIPLDGKKEISVFYYCLLENILIILSNNKSKSSSFLKTHTHSRIISSLPQFYTDRGLIHLWFTELGLAINSVEKNLDQEHIRLNVLSINNVLLIICT